MPNDSPMTDRSPSALDPQDWDQFRDGAHALLDACIDRMAAAHEHPWQPAPADVLSSYRIDETPIDRGFDGLQEALRRDILPFNTGNTHPRFFGWVHGTGLAAGLMAEMVAATMNSNCGGRDHAAIYVERAVIEWCRQVFGFPATASGILVTGTSQATVIALVAARQRALGADSRRDGIRNAPELTAYAVAGTHNATVKALELLGLGSSSLRTIPRDAVGSMDMQALEAAVAQDRKAGAKPFCVIGTAGSVDLGLYDRLDAIADFCQAQQIWFHVDGAFGAWSCLADAPWCGLASGLERADSLAFDFHKWMYVQYDCGAVLIRDEQAHRAAFAARPAYLAGQHSGLAGGDPWYCDYGTDLSRGFRALKIWSALKMHGRDAFAAAITRNCRQAALMGNLVEVSPTLRLALPVCSNVCCFSVTAPSLTEEELDELHENIAQALQIHGKAVFSTTRHAGRVVLRAAIVNHRTTDSDIHDSIAAVEDVRKSLLGENASIDIA